MASAQIVETSVSNNSPSQDSSFNQSSSNNNNHNNYNHNSGDDDDRSAMGEGNTEKIFSVQYIVLSPFSKQSSLHHSRTGAFHAILSFT